MSQNQMELKMWKSFKLQWHIFILKCKHTNRALNTSMVQMMDLSKFTVTMEVGI